MDNTQLTIPEIRYYCYYVQLKSGIIILTIFLTLKY